MKKQINGFLKLSLMLLASCAAGLVCARLLGHLGVTSLPGKLEWLMVSLGLTFLFPLELLYHSVRGLRRAPPEGKISAVSVWSFFFGVAAFSFVASWF